jgi:hypothetical protein
MQLQRAQYVTQSSFWYASDILSIERLTSAVSRQARHHWRHTFPPAGAKRAAAFAHVQQQLLLHAYVRSRDIVEGPEENYPLPYMLSVSSLP